MKQLQFTLNAGRHVTLTAYLQGTSEVFPDIPARPAILILPGGGYQHCSERESDPVAAAYLQAGYHAFILRYSLGSDAVWPNPLEDYEAAMSMIREHSEAWGVYPDKIAVLGFSAGGHLAACAATMSQNRPNAAILGYAAVNKAIAQMCEFTAPDAVAAVSSDTCPCFLFTSRTDPLVPVENTLQFTMALAAYNVSFESHIYAYGPHGFSTGHPSIQDNAILCSRIPNWVPDSIGWLRDMFGDFVPGGMTAPSCAAHFTGDNDPFLSLDCTMNHLLSIPQAGAVLTDFFSTHTTGLAQAAPQSLTALPEGVRQMTLRTVLEYTPADAADADALNAALEKIANL